MRVQWRRHPGDDVLMDMLTGSPDKTTRDHVSGCVECRVRVEAAADGLERSRDVAIPEPPALYWEALRRQIGRQIEGTQPRRRGHPLLWWPAGAAVALVLAALSGPTSHLVPGVPGTVAVAPVPAWSALPPAEEDDGLGVLSGLSLADLGPAAECRDAADCLAGLSDEESRVLAEALRGEIRGGAL